MFGSPPAAHPFESKARRRSRRASISKRFEDSEQGSTKCHSFSASSEDPFSPPSSIKSPRPNSYASDLVTSPTSIPELSGSPASKPKVVTLSISTKSRSPSSGFPYSDDLFNLGIPPTKWSTFTQEIITAVKKDALENADGDIIAAWVIGRRVSETISRWHRDLFTHLGVKVSLKLPCAADAGESEQGEDEAVQQTKNHCRKKGILSNLGWKKDVPDGRKFRLVLIHTRTLSEDQAQIGAPRPISNSEEQDDLAAGWRKSELVAHIPVGGKGHEVELEATEVPLTPTTSSIRDTAELSFLPTDDSSRESWYSISP